MVCRQLGDGGQPGGQRARVDVVGIHIGGEEGQLAVVGDVAPFDRHGAVRGLGEEVSSLPAVVLACPDVVFQSEVIGGPDFWVAVAGQVEKSQREGFGVGGEHLGLPAVLLLEVEVHAGLRVVGSDAVLCEFSAVGAGDQVEAAVAVAVSPAHGVGVAVDAGQGVELEARPLSCGGGALVVPEGDAVASSVGEEEIGPAVAVDIDGGDGAGEAGGQRLGGKIEPAFVPQDGAVSVDAGKDQVEQTVLVQVIGCDTGAVADVGADLAQAGAGCEIQPMGDKASTAGRAPRQREMGHLCRCGRQGGGQGGGSRLAAGQQEADQPSQLPEGGKAVHCKSPRGFRTFFHRLGASGSASGGRSCRWLAGSGCRWRGASPRGGFR